MVPDLSLSLNKNNSRQEYRMRAVIVLWTGCYLGLLNVSAVGESLVIDVHAPDSMASTSALYDSVLNNRNASDAGDALNSLSGVESARKGGRGFEPVIHGQQQSRINVLTDGTRAVGACPSRMDPPTGQFSPAGYDHVTLLRGVSTLQYGASASGGTLLFERDRYDFHQTHNSGHVTGDYKSNGDSWNSEFDWQFGNTSGLLRLYGDYTDNSNYHDGNGNTVSAAWKGQSGGALLALPLPASSRIELNVEAVRDKNLLYAGNGMDAPYADTDTWRLLFRRDESLGIFDILEFNLWHTDISHLMDDYSLRDRKPQNIYGARTPSTAETLGARFIGTVEYELLTCSLGIDWLETAQNARRWKVDKSGKQPDKLTSLLWPDVQVKQFGIFSEFDYDIDTNNSLKAGVRVDSVTIEARKSSQPALGKANPESLYKKYYNTVRDHRRDNNISALLSWSHQLNPTDNLTLKTSRTQRSPDATESYLASFGGCCSGNGSWIGNPELNNETHQQYSLDFEHQDHCWNWQAGIWLDTVNDYIERYQKNGVTLYRNTNAQHWGADLSGDYLLTEHWRLRAGSSWVCGRDTSESHDLAQIPPLELKLGVDYFYQRWHGSLDWWLAAKQADIDPASGLDPGKTPGYGVLHFSGRCDITQTLQLQAGIENLFDKTWTRHINSASRDPFASQAVRVNEPGRRLWVKAIYRW